jgi:hypothetical protein
MNVQENMLGCKSITTIDFSRTKYRGVYGTPPKGLSSRLTKQQSKALSATFSFTNLSSNAQSNTVVYVLL